MKPHTKAMHESIIRGLRGLLTAWEKWLESETSTDKSADKR